MGFISKLFSSDSKHSDTASAPKNFVDCLNAVRTWSARAALDPDFDMNDRNLHSALNTPVTCPYCNAHYQFGRAVNFTGTSVEIRCPSCHTTPKN